MNAYREWVKLFQFSLVAWVILSEDENRWKVVELKSKLSILWNLKDQHFVSLGRGYFSCYN